MAASSSVFSVSASTRAPRSADLSELVSPLLLATVANAILLVILPPVGALGLAHCLRARAASRRGDRPAAALHAERASVIARVWIHLGLAFVAVAVVVVLHAMP